MKFTQFEKKTKNEIENSKRNKQLTNIKYLSLSISKSANYEPFEERKKRIATESHYYYIAIYG